jgi:hypothetical protein
VQLGFFIMTTATVSGFNATIQVELIETCNDVANQDY